MLISNNSIKGTMREFFNVIGKATGLKREELRWWNIVKEGSSNVIYKEGNDLTIVGKEIKYPGQASEIELEVSKYWVFIQGKDSSGLEQWVLRTFKSKEAAKEYYKMRKQEDLEYCLLFFNCKLVKIGDE